MKICIYLLLFLRLLLLLFVDIVEVAESENVEFFQEISSDDTLLIIIWQNETDIFP